MLKKKCFFALSLISITLSSCCNKCEDNDELRTIPVTNNPQIVPERAGGLPMISNNREILK